MSALNNEYQDVVTKALQLLTLGLREFVRDQLKHAHGESWLDAARSCFRNDRNIDELSANIETWDAHALLSIMWEQWNAAFRRKLGLFERSLVAELRAFRNRWAHQKGFNFDDTYRFLDSVNRLLAAIGTSNSANLSELKFELLKSEFAESINAQSLETENRRDRWVVSAVYFACGAVFVALIPKAFGEQTWPLSAAFGVSFLYLIYKRMKWKPSQIGPHECRHCRRIIYGTQCPYCAERTAFDSAAFKLGEHEAAEPASSAPRVPR